MKDNIFKVIMVGYTENHTRDTEIPYKQETKTVIISTDIKWTEWKVIDQEEMKKMLCNMNEQKFGREIEEVIKQDKTPKSESEDPLHVQIISNEGKNATYN